MQCMKCGREVEAEQVFCAQCLAGMEKYPVKPGTVVQLPPRPSQPAAKKQPNHHRKPLRPPEEQVKLLRKRARILACALALALAALIGTATLLVKEYVDSAGKLLPGQNYSSAASAGTESGK